MTAPLTITDGYGWCPPCQRSLISGQAVQDHNVRCSHDGERRYDAPRGLLARTVEIPKPRIAGAGKGKGMR